MEQQPNTIQEQQNDVNNLKTNQIGINGKLTYPIKREQTFIELSQGAVTATPKPPTTELSDIFISVKTTKSYHATRLPLIIKTWFQLAKDQVRLFFFPFFCIMCFAFFSFSVILFICMKEKKNTNLIYDYKINQRHY